MNVLTFDFECTTCNKGNPFDQRNFAVCLAVKFIGEDVYVKYFDEDIKKLQYAFDKADLLVAFNAKFDLHWLRNIGVNFSGKRIWDCQLGEFLLSNQKNPYPSLENTAIKYELGHKIDVIKTDYWEKGINTDEIPREVLTPYVEQDVLLTEQVYLKQLAQFEQDDRYALFRLQCQDLVVLEDMEYNGILFDVEGATNKAKEIENELVEIHKGVCDLLGNGSTPLNLNSNDHLSAILYGGTVSVDARVPVGQFKSGQKVGQTRFKVITKNYEFPRLVEPLEKTEVKKPLGSPPVWFTNDDVLRSLKHTKESRKLVALITKYSELEKLRGTYLVGWPAMIEKMNWEQNTIHGQFNQCVARTGRLSSSSPNLQNADKTTKSFCISRYDN